jgi:alkylation response protein AidB-like acyl-CoA dehydrogenase
VAEDVETFRRRARHLYDHGRGSTDPRFRADKHNDGWVLNGVKTSGQEAATADVFLPTARPAEGLTPFLPHHRERVAARISTRSGGA